jgi:hypothetical protein
VAVALAGCGGGAHWNKPDATPQELADAIGACERDAAVMAEDEAFAGRGGPNSAVIDVDRARGITRDVHGQMRRSAHLSEKARRDELFRKCMHVRGYRPARD